MFSWLFLVMALFSAGLSFNIFQPQRRGGRRVVGSFFAGWLWGELAPHVIALQAIAVGIFAYFGALESPVGWLALLITAASCGWHGVHFLESASAGDVAEQALQHSLGEAYHDEVHPELREGFAHAIRWNEVVRPFKLRHPEVECIRDIRFDRQKGIDLELDIYRHRSHPQKRPVLLQIHGGAWVIGDKKEQALPLMNQLASKGWICASSNYRLSPHATFPDHLIDVKKALAWLRENVAEYGGDPDFIAITGGSAGGHLTALAALTANDPEYQPGFEQVDTSVRAAVPIYGVYDFTNRFGHWDNTRMGGLLEKLVFKGHIDEIPEEYAKASPMDRVHAERPPFFLIHGNADSLAPVEDARSFADILRETGGAPVVYAEIPRAQHAFEIFKSVRSQLVVDGIERFLAYVYTAYLADQGKVVNARDLDLLHNADVTLPQGALVGGEPETRAPDEGPGSS